MSPEQDKFLPLRLTPSVFDGPDGSAGLHNDLFINFIVCRVLWKDICKKQLVVRHLLFPAQVVTTIMVMKIVFIRSLRVRVVN